MRPDDGRTQTRQTMSQLRRLLPHAWRARRRSELEQLRLLVEGVGVYAIFMLDPSGRVASWNAGAARVEGYGAADIIGRHVGRLYPPEEAAAGKPELALQRAVSDGRYEEEGWRLRADGSRFWASVVITPVYEKGRLRGFAQVVRDVTERRLVTDALAASEERFRSHFEHVAVGQAMTAMDGRFVLVNDAFADMTGYERGELLGLEFLTLVHPDDRERNLDLVVRLLAGEVSSFDTDIRLLRKDGGIVHVRSSVSVLRDRQGEPTFITAVIENVTDRKRAEEQLAQLALHDPLTGLPNRSLLLDRLGQSLARASRTTAPVGVLFFDLDRFKEVNDGLGHTAGDALLVSVGARLAETVRAGDTVARLGGDEFVVVSESADGTLAMALAERCREAIAVPFPIQGRDLLVTTSVGIALGAQVDSPEKLLDDADVAMYRAKERGRNRCELFDEAMAATARVRFQMSTELRRAVDRDELVVLYQPEVSLATGLPVAVEALVGWQHPTRGLLGQAEFFALAEEAGLSLAIGETVLHQACRQCAAWQAAHVGSPPAAVSVNLANRQLLHPDLPSLVEAALREANLGPDSLRLEIAHTTPTEDLERASTTLDALRELGVHLGVDHFGTGSSSLLHLRRFPVETLKIDSSFVAGLTLSVENDVLVRGVIGLAHAVGLATVAEGVQTRVQRERLMALGCGFGQGEFWTRPLAPEAAMAWLQDAWTLRSDTTTDSEQTRSYRVVVADDDADLRAMLKVVLEGSNAFQVVAEAENGVEAIEAVERHHPDLVLLDLVMPVLDGLDALPALIRAAPTAQIAILSGHSLADRVSAGIDGADVVYLQKGIEPPELVRTLLEMLDAGPASTA